MWKKLSYPTCYAVIYTVKSKHNLYIVCVIKHFLAKENGKVIQFEVNCLKPHCGSKNILEAYSDDVHIFLTNDLINGLIKVIDLITKGKFDVQGYQNLLEIF